MILWFVLIRGHWGADKLKMQQHEAGCPATEGIILCYNNCGFFGTKATMNTCFKCHMGMILKQKQSKLATLTILWMAVAKSQWCLVTHTWCCDLLKLKIVSSQSPNAPDRMGLKEQTQNMVEIDAEHAGNVRPTVDVGTFSGVQIAALMSMMIAHLIIVNN